MANGLFNGIGCIWSSLFDHRGKNWRRWLLLQWLMASKTHTHKNVAICLNVYIMKTKLSHWLSTEFGSINEWKIEWEEWENDKQRIQIDLSWFARTTKVERPNEEWALNAECERRAKKFYKGRVNDDWLATGKHRSNSLFLWNQIGMKKPHVCSSHSYSHSHSHSHRQCVSFDKHSAWIVFFI